MILQKLKETTRPQHEELESVVNVMDQMFKMDDYKRLIARFHRFYKAYEPTLPIGELARHGFDYEARRKLPLLEADVSALGIDEMQAFRSLPEVATLPQAFGSLYVIEGSTLGGQVISRHLKQHLGLAPENGAMFFSSYGAQVGPMWKQFGEAITAFAEGAIADDEIIAAAQATFESIKRNFQEDAAASTAVAES